MPKRAYNWLAGAAGIAVLSTALVAGRATGCDLCAISTAADEKRSLEDDLELAPGAVPEPCSGAQADRQAAPLPFGAPGQIRSRSTVGGNVGLLANQVDASHPLIDEHEAEDPARQYLRSTTVELFLGVRLGERLGVRAYVPYIERRYRRSVPSGVEEGSLYGPGDSVVEGTVLALRRMDARSAALVTVIGGVKLPTGDSSFLDEEGTSAQGQTTVGGHVHGFTGGTTRALVHPHQLALGTGSYDGIAGISSFWRLGALFATARLQYDLRGPGRAGYREGDELSWGGGPGYDLVQRGRGTVGLLANVTGETRGHDHLDGQIVDDSGLTEVFLGPDLTATWRGLSAEAGVDLPIFQRVSGEQLVTTYRAHVGLNVGF